MALFSRRPKKPSDSEPTDAPVVDGQSVDAADVERAGAADGVDAAAGPDAGGEADAAPSVSISVSSFGGLGAGPTAPATPTVEPDAATQAPATKPRPRAGARTETEVAPAAAETVPGLRDNVLLRTALSRLGQEPPSQALLEVARQLLQGHVFLRVKGDARALLSEGKDLPLAVATAGERTFALAYSSGAALQASLRADGDADTSAMGQPVLNVLRHVTAGSYDGIIIDHASAPARAVLPKELLQRVLEQADPQLTVKTLLAGERSAATAAAVAEALTRVPLWVAVGTAPGGQPGLAEGRSTDGTRFLEVYSHPLEVAVMGRGDNAAPITGAQLARALGGDDGLAGVLVDPAGPWMRLTRADLVPVLALG
jgi:hypothetical protein